MTRSDQQRVDDIIDAAREIAEFVSNGRTAWDEERAVRLATERLLEIIGSCEPAFG